MIDVQKKKRERQKLIDAMRKITSEAEKRDDKKLTEEERTEWSRLNDEVNQAAEEILRDERMNALETETAGNSDDNSAPPASDGKRFETFGDFLQSVRSACTPGGKVDSRLIEARAGTGLNETDPGDGGFLVQTDQLTEIMKRMYDTAQLAGRCRRVGIGALANGLAWKSLDETSRATGSRWGGVRGYWAAEASTVTASQPKFKRSRMDLEKLMAFVYMTEEMLQDTTGMESFTTQLVSDELAWLLDEAIVTGTGAGQPLGWLNSDCIVSVAKETGQAADTIVYENIVKMWARMWARSRSNAVWYINQDCEPQLHTMALVVGAGGVPVYVPATSAAPTPLLYGRPVISIEQAKTVGDNGDINLVDLSQYMLIDKGGVKRAASIHVRFLYDEQVYRFTYRVNGQPTWNSALTPANGTNTLSPFITLAARG